MNIRPTLRSKILKGFHNCNILFGRYEAQTPKLFGCANLCKNVKSEPRLLYKCPGFGVNSQEYEICWFF